MLSFIVAVILLCIGFVTVVAKKQYEAMPVREWRRRARNKDTLAQSVYRAVAYEDKLWLFLWIVIVLCFAISFLLLSRAAPPLFGFVVVAFSITLAFVWLPGNDEHTKKKDWIILRLTPVIVWMLRHVQPVLHRITTLRHSARLTIHTGLYEREDLLELLARQQGQADSRIAPEELELLMTVLQFGEKLVHECMVPRSSVHLISATEQISPIVIRELHETGYTRFPVYGDTEDTIVGTLYLSDLTDLKHMGSVAEIMKSEVYYVHEDYPVEQALHAFLTTKHQLFIVINNFEEFVGIITIEDILTRLFGYKIVDEFNQYEDKHAVTTHQRESLVHPIVDSVESEASPEKTISEDTTEVVQ